MRTCGRGHEWNPEETRQCPVCQKVYRKKRYSEFKEHDYKKAREWVEKNRDHVSNTNKEWEYKHPANTCYRSMLNRCLSLVNDHFHHYGGRGIKVCDRWRGEDGYANFLADMGERPTKKHTIERMNVNGGYKPSNCIWATRKQQGRNRRINREVTLDGRTQCIAEWAEEIGVTFATMWLRIDKGLSEEEILSPNSQPEQKEKRELTALETNQMIFAGLITRSRKAKQTKGSPAINGIGAEGFAAMYGVSENAIGHFRVAKFAAAPEEERLAFVARCRRRKKGSGKPSIV